MGFVLSANWAHTSLSREAQLHAVG